MRVMKNTLTGIMEMYSLSGINFSVHFVKRRKTKKLFMVLQNHSTATAFYGSSFIFFWNYCIAYTKQTECVLSWRCFSEGLLLFRRLHENYWRKNSGYTAAAKQRMPVL